MRKGEQKTWSQAYAASHVCADICERVLHAGVEPTAERAAWLVQEAENLLKAARAVKRGRRLRHQ